LNDFGLEWDFFSDLVMLEMFFYMNTNRIGNVIVKNRVDKYI